MSNIGIIVLDFQTLQLQRAYLSVQTPCDELNLPVDDEELALRAGGLFSAVRRDWPRRILEDEEGVREELAFETSHKGDLALLELLPGDFGGFAVLHRCSGLVVYAGSIVWMGTGQQLYPAMPIDPGALKRTWRHQVPPPEQIDVMIGPYARGAEAEGLAAWRSIQNLNFVQDLASGPYSVLVYLYPRSVGAFAPAHANWVIFVHRHPVLEPNVRLASTPTPRANQLWPTPTTPIHRSPLPTPILETDESMGTKGDRELTKLSLIHRPSSMRGKVRLRLFPARLTAPVSASWEAICRPATRHTRRL